MFWWELMNLTELFKRYDFHDSYIDRFEYDLLKRRAICCLNLGDWNDMPKCEIRFINVNMFHIEADNSEFAENELISAEVSSEGCEHFKGFFSEGFGRPGKVIEIKCEYIEHSREIFEIPNLNANDKKFNI
ncbi:MAG: hypothetical protein K2K57_11345 [Oscillospiraceae bacterium]|nr:hypothetical protein [Oscillospiraceae bacterium]